MNIQLLDNIAFKAIIENTEYLEYFQPEYFEEKIKQYLIKEVQNHFRRFNQVPSVEQLKQIIKITYEGGDIDMVHNYVDVLYNIDLNEYTKDWLEKSIKSFISIRQLDHSVKKLLVYLKTTPIKMENVDTILQDCRGIITDGTDIKFGMELGADIFNPESYKFSNVFKVNSGYNFINTVTKGGFSNPGLHIIVGPPKSGKTLWLGNIAIEMVKTGLTGAFISLEMPEYAMLQRFGPKLFNIKIDDFEKVSQNPFEMGKLIQNFKSASMGMGDSLFSTIKSGELFLKEFPTSTATTIDLRNYINKLEEKRGLKLDFIIVDYINILANWRNPNTENTYIKVKQIAEDLRAMSQDKKMVVISATQTKRGTEESSDYGSGDIIESSGLNHTLDSEFGIIQTPEMYANREYVLKCMLNRHGGMKFARQKFFVDYDYMSIRESDEPIQELDA